MLMCSSKITCLLCVVLLFFGCNDNLFHRVKLISPANRSQVEPGTLNFVWKTKEDDPVRFILATEDFKTTLTDTTLTGNAYSYRAGLEADSNYVWKVEQGEYSNVSKFHVIDYSTRFNREYLGLVQRYTWIMGGPSQDTSYTAKIRLEKVDNEMKVTGDKELLLSYVQATDTSTQYGYPSNTSIRALLDLNFVNGAIHLLCFTGGLGGGTNYRFDSGI